MGTIRINQMGYLPNSTKKVVYVGKETKFLVLDVKKDTLVMEGSLANKGLDDASQDNVCMGDFSALTEAGHYMIRIGNDSSPIFQVSEKQVEICTDALLKAFYYQRCGVELTEEFAGPWKHDQCHLQPSYVYHPEAEMLIENNAVELELLDTTGGWHDAGDYGRYTIAAAKAVADLLLAYEQFGNAFDHTIDIPESKLEGADLLHEVKVELDFLFKMQRKTDGSVYTKVATRYFPGMIMPEEDTKPLFIFDVSSPATADFAATMALAARVYKTFDKEYAKKCLEAAETAYQWLKMNREPKLFQNPANIVSGEYGDISDLDERYWAAAELYRTTGNKEYHKDFLYYYKLIQDKVTLGWGNMSGYGTIAYLLTEQEVDKTVYEDLRTTWLEQATVYEKRSKEDGYGITLSLSDYKWGSMMILLNHGMHLIIANQLIGSNQYDPIISNNWDYLFGLNPMDISYVTGLGERAVMAPHHRPSAGDEVLEPVPGLVSGGPCAGLYDDAAKEFLQGQPPAKCFIDHVGSYSTNEITIYWNSPAVYVGAYLCNKR